MDGLFVFLVGAAGYSVLEVLWRGYTHWTMMVTGGVCLSFIYFLNLWIDAGVLVKAFLGCIIITLIELLVGVVVNIHFKWNVWDYSALPFNIKGQVCLLYSVLWFLLSIPVVKICDLLKILLEKG